MINKEQDFPSLYRVLDANINRLKEGIRVVEDIFRYFYNIKDIAKELKELRHDVVLDIYLDLLDSRDVINDCLKESIPSENSRKSIQSVIIANFKRAEESARVIEEVSKILNVEFGLKFKNIRYKLYTIEKNAMKKLEKLEN